VRFSYVSATPSESEDVSEDRPTVRLELDSSPETLTLVRGALGGVGELLAFDPELLDDLKTAVSEACNNVVMHAYDGAPGPLGVRLYIHERAIEVIVRDDGIGIPALTATDERLQGVGLPVIQALTQEAEFRPRPEGGTEVWMLFDGQREGEALFRGPGEAAPDQGWVEGRLSGDAVASLSPVSVVGAVLGRLSRALAARARFSLDRFSDVYVVTDANAAHAADWASEPRIGFGLATHDRRLELMVGPFRAGSSAQLSGDPPAHSAGSALVLLSDELEIVPADGEELLRVVMVDQERPRGAEGDSS
jgi:serine/threonine-protein kinase RsbW